MNKITGVLALLIYTCVATALISDSFVEPFNLQNQLRWTSLYGIIGIGVAIVIITGGIDLSIGSVIGLVGCALPMLLAQHAVLHAGHSMALVTAILAWEMAIIGVGWAAFLVYRRLAHQHRRSFTGPALLVVGAVIAAVLTVMLRQWEAPRWLGWGAILMVCLGIAVHLGLMHGLLITKLKLQPFVVTLCGLLIYRGVARWIAGDQTQGYGNMYDDSLRLLAIGRPCTVPTLLIMIGGAMALGGAIRALLMKSDENRRVNRPLAWTILVLGIGLAVIGSSRFWNGYEVQTGTEIVQIGNWTLSTWSVQVPSVAQARPKVLMQWMGSLATLVAVGWLAYIAFRNRQQMVWSDGWKLAAGVAALAVGLGLLFAVHTFHGQLGRLRAAPTEIVLAVLGGLALIMGAVAFLFRLAARLGGPAATAPLVAAAIGVLIWLSGYTQLATTRVPTPFFILLGVAIIGVVLLNHTVWGRYLFALGRNEEAARFSGINTDRMVIFAYIFCSFCAGLGGILFSLDAGSVQPSGLGNFGELYAIAAAVLGGCSLRGGEGTILGVIIGAAVMRVLYNSIGLLANQTQLEHAIIGAVILLAVVSDEVVKRWIARKRLQQTRASLRGP